MKLVIIFTLFTVAVATAPKEFLKIMEKERPVVLREHFANNNGTGAYNYAYELSNGENKQETAQVKHGFLIIRGSYTQIDPATGEQYTVNYVADKNGFRPVGPHLPK